MKSTLTIQDDTVTSDSRQAGASWWQEVLKAQHHPASWLARFGLFVWVASIPSVAIFANLAVKRFEEIHTDHLIAEMLHYYLFAYFWPVGLIRHSMCGVDNANMVWVLLLQVIGFWVLCLYFLAKTHGSPITFRHLLPAAVVFSANSAMTWVVGIRHC